MKFSLKQVVVLISAVILIICYNYYLTWKFYPLRSATASEKLNFKNYQDFNHGIVDEFNKKVYVLFHDPATPVEMNKVEIKNKPQVQSKSQGCVGFGDESCIDKVRESFNSTGKNILSEQYLGNGQFGISFLDPSRGESYNAKVSTDCNCNILDVSTSVMR